MKWDPDFTKRKKMKAILDTLIPEFLRPLGRIDLHRCYEARHRQSLRNQEAANILAIAIAEMIFIGDALFPGGNDYPAENAGVASHPGPRSRRRPNGSSKQSSRAWVVFSSA